MFVSREVGNARPEATLSVGSHLFDEAANIDRAREHVNGQLARLNSGGFVLLPLDASCC